MTAPQRRSAAPGITMYGEMVLGGLRVEFTLVDEEKGPEAFEDGISWEQMIVTPGQTLSLPRQPVLGGIGGDPFIWIKLADDHGTELSSELFVGRCVCGSIATAADVALPVTVTVDVATGDRSKDSAVSLEGSMLLPALHARLILRNGDAPLDSHSYQAEMCVDALLRAGQTIRFPESRALGGIGGNPWIWLRWLHGSGEPIGVRNLLGRCVEMSK